MKVVVTGGSGQLGQQVIAELSAHGYEVLSLDRKPHPGGHRPSWTVELRDAASVYQACTGAGALVHLAAHIAPNLASDTATFNDNVALTYNALKAAADMGVRRVVFASSIAAYGFLYGAPGRTPDYLPVDEAHPCAPTDPYGLSKVVAETIADSVARRAVGMSIASLRFPGINYEPSYERIKRLMADPGFRRSGFWSYIDVRDAAAACRLAIEAPLSGHRVFNVAAPGSNMREPTRKLIERYFPAAGNPRRHGDGNWSGIDSTRAETELGFRAGHGWEQILRE